MRRLKFSALSVLALAAVLTLSGCGNSNLIAEKVAEKALEKQLGGNADVNIKNDGTATYKTDQGTLSTENKVPDSWPKDAPVYPGATVSMSSENNDQEKSVSLTLSSTEASAKIFEYYQTELKNQGWTVTSSSTTPYGNVLEATKDTKTMSVVIMTADSGSQITAVVKIK